MSSRKAVSKSILIVILMIIILIACVGAFMLSTTGRASPDFTITVSPSSIVLTHPKINSTTATITVTSREGFSSTVTLSIGGVRTGMEAKLEPSSITPPPNGETSSILNVTIKEFARSGTYQLAIAGRSSSLTHSTVLVLTVVHICGRE